MAQISELRAGVARRVISPPRGIFLIGYGDRTKGNIGVHDDLTATALVLNTGPTCLAIVSLDILTINEFIVDRVRRRLPSTEVLLCCSHTHSGPISYADSKSSRRNQAYIDSLVDNITAAVEDASAHLAPARLEFACGEAGIAINRRERMPDGRMEIGRNPAGVVDRSLQVVSVFRDAPLPAGEKTGGTVERLATLINFACHGTVLGPDNLLVSADWIGAMRSRVEAELGGLALFIQGATANLNPDMYWNDERAFDMVAEQGLSVANAALAAIRRGSEPLRGIPLKLERLEAWLPTEAAVTSRRPPRNYAKPLLAMAKLPGWMAFLADPLLKARYPWKARIEARNGTWCVPMRVNAVRIGDLALLTFAAETFTEIGLALKAASPARQTLFASITDGCISYLHTQTSHAEGGYEVDVAPLAYRYPGRLAQACEVIALQAAQECLGRLWKG